MSQFVPARGELVTPPKPKQCRCGSKEFWLRGNEWICKICHPEIKEEVKNGK